MLIKFKKKLLALLCFFVCFIVLPSNASSELLWPFQVGYMYKYIEQDKGGDPTYEFLIVKEKVTINSIEYFRITEFDPEHPGLEEDFYARSTEDAVYKYNPEGDEILIFQIGPTGTTWYNFHEEDGEGFYYYFYEVVDDNATVNFDLGHEPLTGAYKIRWTQKCKDLEQTDCSPEHTFDWIVPNLGWVKAYEWTEDGDWYLIELSEILIPCEGDFNGDKDVDGSDLAIFAADFGRTDCSGGPDCEGDFDEDGDVDGSDLATFAADFGRTDCP